MELNRTIWNKEDIESFNEYLLTFQDTSKVEWSTRLLQTKLPVLCMKTKDMKAIVNELSKGNFYRYLDFMPWRFYENTAINGSLINLIDDFTIKKKYLDLYSNNADNWATCDLLTFHIQNQEDNYLFLSNEYQKSCKPFVRRIGLYILFNFLDNPDYQDLIFSCLEQFEKEENYYVNMMCAWLLSELMIQNPKKSFLFFQKDKINAFVCNKSIQKYRESRRVSNEEKENFSLFKKITKNRRKNV